MSRFCEALPLSSMSLGDMQTLPMVSESGSHNIPRREGALFSPNP